jgi:PLAT/LH2 domain
MLLGVAVLITTFAVGQQAATAQAPADPTITRVTIRTGTDWQAGTDARVWITLHGTKHTLWDQPLNTWVGTAMERGTHITYYLQTVPPKDLGNIRQVCLKSNDAGLNPSWKVGSVTIWNHHNRDGRIFSFNGWIPGGGHKWCRGG